MVSNLTLKQGDLEPPLVATLLGSDGAPLDVTTALAVTFRMAPWDTREELFSRAATIDVADEGRLSYVWWPGDTEVAGVYYAEFVITWPEERDQTFPASGYLRIVIEPHLTSTF